jgi:hypothetical protein
MISALLGVSVGLYAGHPTPRRLSAGLSRLVEEIEVSEVADGQCGFQVTFGAERLAGLSDYQTLLSGALAVNGRMAIVIFDATTPIVLIDGLITDQWLDPANGSEPARFVLTGADLSAAMDADARQELHRGRSDGEIVAGLVRRYSAYGLKPDVPSLKRPPLGMSRPPPTGRARAQRGTDLDYIYALAERYGYVFTVRPKAGVPGSFESTAYWGPPRRSGLQRPALSVATGVYGAVEDMSFAYDSRAAVRVKGDMQEMDGDRQISLAARLPTLLPLALRSAFTGKTRTALLDRIDGLTYAEAMARAQGVVNSSAARTVTARGVVDSLTYGHVLRAGDTVNVRGAGQSFDGAYAVEHVTHLMKPGDYRQRVVLGRDGVKPRSPVVPT